MIKFGNPQVGKDELGKIKEVFDSKIFVHGNQTEQFENDFKSEFGYDFALSVANCTAGLHLAHFSLTKNLDSKVRSKSEVICTAMTHVATAHAIELAGLKPIFVDCQSNDGNVDISLLRNAINMDTVGIAAMHFNGVPCDINSITNIAEQENLYIIEDCAIALGATVNGKPVGSFGDAGTFSFHPVKQMTTGEGGMVTLKNKKIYDELKIERAFGVDRNFIERDKAGVYDVPLLGFNYRMAEIPAAMGIKQLEKFRTAEEIRKRNFINLKNEISQISNLRIKGEQITDGRAYYCLIAEVLGDSISRDALAHKLKDKGIQTSVYYPHPVPRLAYYAKKYGYDAEKFKNSEMISDRSISFSIGAHLSDNDILKLVDELKRCCL